AEICDKGNMTANTAAYVQPGTSITLSCLDGLQRSQAQLFSCIKIITLNILSTNTLTHPPQTMKKQISHFLTCLLSTSLRKKLIRISVSDPPDEPRNVSCIQHGADGHPTCTWNKGRLTYINTTYVILLSNGTDVLCVSEESLNKNIGSLALSKLNFDSTYTVVVAASNELGSAFSQPLVFMLIDIVKPHPPNFLVEFENSSATNCTFFWHDEAQARHCRLRYRPLTSKGNYDAWSLYGLEPHTTYEFQVSCKIHPERGLWSNWTTYQRQTPEAVPTGLLDVWYRQQDVDSQRQNISLFWKALSSSEARGRILRYAVTFEALDRRSAPAGEAHRTTQTSYTRVTPRVGYRITVTAENSRGRSPPASVVTNPGTQDLPPPQKVSTVAMGNGSILVRWKPPARSAVSISGYVVEWADTQRNARPEPHPAWAKLPASSLSAVIAGNYCLKVGYGRGTILFRKSAVCFTAPSAGPQMYATPQANGILVSWEEIPAHHQRGCITGYRLYLQKKDGQRWLYLPDLQPGQHYALWMTASTAAGEGPGGNSELLCLESNASRPGWGAGRGASPQSWFSTGWKRFSCSSLVTEDF
uniref:Fibronectin type-III domain-containing protein n=1 Tax=Buteo japonicus TaxID=224669 RepID=A0A8B9ZCC3_9AVES